MEKYSGIKLGARMSENEAKAIGYFFVANDSNYDGHMEILHNAVIKTDADWKKIAAQLGNVIAKYALREKDHSRRDEIWEEVEIWTDKARKQDKHTLEAWERDKKKLNVTEK